MNKAILFLIWVLTLFLMTSIGFDLINKPSTIGNLAGVVVLAMFVLVSINTKCFTSITTKSKTNENNEN